jgi:PKHD-type hydroxylase
MKGEWCYFNKHFSDSQCDEIIRLAHGVPLESAKMGAVGEITESLYRKSNVRFLQKTDTRFTFLFDELWKLALRANDDWFDFHLSKLDYIQFSEYDSDYQGEYKKHHDVFYMNGDPKYHRKLTCVIQLSDPETYEGGDFETYDISSTLDPKDIRGRGTVMFIPSFTPHAVTPVTSGVRYSLVAWIDGPKWK